MQFVIKFLTLNHLPLVAGRFDEDAQSTLTSRGGHPIQMPFTETIATAYSAIIANHQLER